MSQIVDDLRQVAIEIKTETQIGGNTAARVGGAFERVADALEGTQQIEDMDAAVAAVQQAAQENEHTIQDIVNSLAVTQTTGQSTSAVMSQKAVTDEISVDGICLPLGSRIRCVIYNDKWSSGNINNLNMASHCCIKVTSGDIIMITGGDKGTNYAWLTSNPLSPNVGDTPPFVAGYTTRYPVSANSSLKVVVPVGAEYLYVAVYNNNNNTTPIVQKIGTIKNNIGIKDNYECDMAFVDNNNNALLMVGQGHLKTKFFDSRKSCCLNIFEDNFQKTYPYTIAINRSTFASNPYTRIPFCEYTNSGRLIVGCDVRYGSSADETLISTGIVLSDDNGSTFGNPQIIIPHTNVSEWDRATDPTILVDRTSGKIFVFAHRTLYKVRWQDTHTTGEHGFDCVFVTSNDNGETWTSPSSLKPLMSGSTYGSDVVTLFGGVGHGITMNDGTLVLPIQCKMASNNTSATGTMFKIQSGIIYSTDGGLTWTRSALIPCYSSECMVVEYEQGKLMLNARSYIGLRRVYVTDDMGSTWTPAFADKTIIEPTACQASFTKVQKGFKSKGLFLNPADATQRVNMLVYETNDYAYYHPVCRLTDQLAGYSCLCGNGRQTIAVYEKGDFTEIRCCNITDIIW